MIHDQFLGKVTNVLNHLIRSLLPSSVFDEEPMLVLIL